MEDDDESRRRSPSKFTPKQGQYLAFIDAYTLLNRRPPAQADIQSFFRVTPPTVYQMLLTLEKAGLISRKPGVARSITVLQLTLLDFGSSLGQAAVTVSAALGTQALASALVGRRPDWRSPLVTGLSLSLLLRTHDPAVWVGAGMLAIGSKYLLRIRGRHVFNPACPRGRSVRARPGCRRARLLAAPAR